MQLPVLLVFSHLRWGFVYQRPQHLMTRLAGRWRVLFVEEPQRCDGPARLDSVAVHPELTVLSPHLPAAATGFHDDHAAPLTAMLDDYLSAHGLHADVAWLTTPLALPLAQALDVDCLVYDCMDELAALKGAPLQLRQREVALMQQAALVLTGSPALHEAHRRAHTNIHCVRSAVDAAHFAPAGLAPEGRLSQQARRLVSGLPRPRLGYFGAIDERLDLDLIASLAERHPEWSLVMVGPVNDLPAGSLPRLPNIHWLGAQPYELLPHLLARWDLALLPFVVNDATRRLSPTKTLQYMAGYRPVVSTPLPDVQQYARAVAVAPAEDFAKACEDVLAENPRARSARLVEMAKLVARHSWEDAADAVHARLDEALVGVREARLDDERLLEEPEPEAWSAVPLLAHRAPAWLGTHMNTGAHA